MLVLTRHIHERLHIGDDIQIVVLSARDHWVRLGIIAPQHIAVHREEIYQRLQAEKNSSRQPQRHWSDFE